MMDEEIIRLFFDRDEEAIGRLDAAYGRSLFHISEGILHCREDAQECVSDTYLRTWNAIPPARPKRLFAYVAKICRNLSLTRLDWTNAAKRKAEVVALTQEMEGCIPDTRRDSDLDARELGRLLNAFLETLSDDNKILFVRRYWFVETTAEIAARYGIKENTLLSRLHRIRKKLAKFLEKEGVIL